MGFFKSAKKHAAASNVLLAKHIYQNSDTATRKKIEERMYEIYSKCWRGSRPLTVERDGEQVFYGIAALAMYELGINPHEEAWIFQPIPNPMVGLFRAEKEIRVAQHGLKMAGINVSLEQ